jgi:L-fuconolactonase
MCGWEAGANLSLTRPAEEFPMDAKSPPNSIELVIDTHHHFWRYLADEYPWITEAMPVLHQDYLPLHLEKAASSAGVSGVISVQARESVAETEALLRMADECPLVRGVVGWAPLTDPRAAEVLDRFCSDPRLLGVREVIQGRPDARFFDNPAFHGGLREVARRNLTYDLLIYADQLPAAIRCVDQHADLNFVLDHAAKPPIAREQFPADWAREIRNLGRRTNVCCKVSGLVTEVIDADWDTRLLQPYFETLLDAFGSDRLMFGSDWPVCLLRSSYPRWVEAVRTLVKPLSAGERERILTGNAARAYRLKTCKPA